MTRSLQRIQTACRGALRPVVQLARKLLTPPAQPIEFVWQKIQAGPAAGTEVILPAGTPIADAITSGNYEHQILKVVGHLVSPQDVCFDIGGHYGYYTLCLGKLAPRGQVHTFEPVQDHAERIVKATQRCGLDHVQVHPMAVADTVGEMTLQFAGGQEGDDSMAFLEQYGGVDTPAAQEHYQRFSRTTVRATTLDQLAHELPAAQFIKIDAEGAEAPILEAGIEMITRARPRLLIELHGIYEALSCAQILDRADYQAILLTDQKVTMPILWAHRNDEQAISAVRRALGRDPIVLFRKPGIDSASAVSIDQVPRT